jgi:hypothetical protein
VYKIIEVTIFTAIDLSGGDIFAYTKYDTDTMLDSMFGVDGSEVATFDIDEFLRVRLEKDSIAGRVMIQALDVDRAEPWPHGQDRQEDQTLPV